MQKSEKNHVSEKNDIWNPSTCTCENAKYLETNIGDSIITCEEIIEVTKIIQTNFLHKKVTHNKMSIFYPQFIFTLYFIHFINYHKH